MAQLQSRRRSYPCAVDDTEALVTSLRIAAGLGSEKMLSVKCEECRDAPWSPCSPSEVDASGLALSRARKHNNKRRGARRAGR